MNRSKRAVFAFAFALAIGVGGCGPAAAGPPADTILFGDNIVTMDPNRASVEAVAVRGETITATGSLDEVMAFRGESTRVVDLGERALLPGFIDAHGHFLGAGRALDALSLHSPPVGDVTNINELVAKIQRWIEEKQIPPGEVVSGGGYDDSLLEEKRHPTRFDLDRASTEHPIVLGHVSGHLRAANSAALAASNVTVATPDPDGGLIRRVAGSMEPNGVFEERAGRLLIGGGPARSPDEFDALIRTSIGVYLGYGTTTIQNGGGTSPQMVETLRAAAEREPFDADLAVFTSSGAILQDRLQYERTYSNGFRVAGVKFVLDGSPQGRTAWVTEPYEQGPPGAAADYRAYGTMDPDDYKANAAALIARGVPFLAHANGDAAMDLMMDGVEQAITDMDEAPDHRSVIIHAQLMRADQLDRAAELRVVPSFFAAHSFFWGDWHRLSFGEERGNNISPVRWAIDRGVHFTVHNDASVVPPDMMRLVSITVNRKTRSGHVLGPHQRATIEEALYAVTLGAAYQYFEEDTKGSITVGKQADLVILEKNPITTDPAELERIQIMETFSRGRSVFAR
ncbi:MAG: amidohydrolase [Gemmatimonadetes bacterium]|jgi:predicted amidohydrolase YtcJ|nr:amidohydrolase [Gemmatimonadota bacterium]